MNNSKEVRSEYILAMLSVPRFGRKSAYKLINDYSNSVTNDEEFAALTDYLRISKPKLFHSWDSQKALDEAKQLIDRSRSFDIGITSLWSAEYPESLRLTKDPPVLLHHIGELKVLGEHDSVALVGTRKPTPHGLTMAESLGARFADNGLCVVSGLALGCDTAGHVGCLRVGGLAVGVLAHGLDDIAPKSSKKLSEEILSNNGLLVSEYPLGITARPAFFVERDRIQAGLSKAVVVVETTVDGGTMHAVRSAVDNERIVACVAPHMDAFVESPTLKGNELLIDNDTARPLRSEEDVNDLIGEVKGFSFDSSSEEIQPQLDFD